jgi:hypothetical protein
MKTVRSFRPSSILPQLRILLAGTLFVLAAAMLANCITRLGPTTLSDRGSFYVHDLGHRCLDFGGPDRWALGAPVFIYSCNGTVAQQVRVKEIDFSHDVELRVESFLPKRSFCIGVRGGQVVVGQPLELQHCNDSPAQRFALDGDAILMGSQASGPVTRELTIEPQNDHTPTDEGVLPRDKRGRV